MTQSALVEADGSPIFILLGPVVAFAADGTSTLAGIVPAGLAGHTFVLQAFALDAQGKLLKSIPETIAFQ